MQLISSKSKYFFAAALSSASFFALATARAEVLPQAKVQDKAAAPATKLTFTNQMDKGKKTWVPMTATVKSGDKVELTLVNTLAEPHGFQIADQVPPLSVVVPQKGTKTVSFTAGKPGTYKISCQLHPAHVAGTFVVTNP